MEKFENLKVIAVDEDTITFDGDIMLYSDHEQDCCESHFLSFADLTLDDFNGLKFDLSGENFFSRVEGYGIRLHPINGQAISIPGYGHNNGYYSSNLTLVVNYNNRSTKVFEITECQECQY